MVSWFSRKITPRSLHKIAPIRAASSRFSPDFRDELLSTCFRCYNTRGYAGIHVRHAWKWRLRNEGWLIFPQKQIGHHANRARLLIVKSSKEKWFAHRESRAFLQFCALEQYFWPKQQTSCRIWRLLNTSCLRFRVKRNCHVKSNPNIDEDRRALMFFRTWLPSLFRTNTINAARDNPVSFVKRRSRTPLQVYNGGAESTTYQIKAGRARARHVSVTSAWQNKNVGTDER